MLRRFGAAVEVWEIRWFGSSVLGIVGRTRVLVLETTGRRTGKRRSTPVACLPDGDGWVIAGGAGGLERVDWVANLRGDPVVHVVARRRRIAVTAVEPVGSEGVRIRERATERWPQIERYERRSGRRTPVFVLRPR